MVIILRRNKDESLTKDGEWDLTSNATIGGRTYCKRHKIAIVPFKERLVHLADYKERYGNCNVPHGRGKEYTSLGNWVLGKNSAQAHITKERNKFLL